MRQPFAQIALVNAGRGGKLAYGHCAALVQSLIEPQRITDPDQCNAPPRRRDPTTFVP